MSIREKYQLDETAVLELKDGNDEPMVGDDGKRVTVTVYAPGTRAFMRAQATIQAATLEAVQRRGKSKKSGEDLRHENAVQAAEVTKEVSENLAGEFPGRTGRDLFLAIYEDEKVGYLISSQVLQFGRDTANFTRESTKS